MNKETSGLVMKAAGRDPDAFSELIQLQMKRFYRTAYAILLNDADAADAIQETILTVWEELPALRNVEYFQTWCTRILINRCCDIRRSRSKEIPLGEWEEPTAEDRYSLEWKEALSALEEKYRVPIELFYGQGYRIAEISEMLNLPENTVKTRIARGREQMKRYYRE